MDNDFPRKMLVSSFPKLKYHYIVYNMFCCSFCREEYLLYSSLCLRCEKVYKLGTIYGFDTIFDIVDRCLLIPEDKQEKRIIKITNSIVNDPINVLKNE